MMEKYYSLLIITSPNGPEYENYWELRGKKNPIVKNGSERGVFKIALQSIERQISTLEEMIDDNGYIVMIHSKKNTKYITHKFEKSGKLIDFIVYYYSTQDVSLIGDLWNINKDNYKYTGPRDSPLCPFDKLRYDIINNTDIEQSIKEITKWVNGKVFDKKHLLNIKRAVFNECLYLETAKNASKINNFDLVKDIIVVDGLNVDFYIRKVLMNINNIDEYNEKLTILRDVFFD